MACGSPANTKGAIVEVFKTFGTKLEIHVTRAYVEDIGYEEATLAAQQIDWRQFHIIRNGDGTVNASFILDKDVSSELWKFVAGNTPDPLLA